MFAANDQSRSFHFYKAANSMHGIFLVPEPRQEKKARGKVLGAGRAGRGWERSGGGGGAGSTFAGSVPRTFKLEHGVRFALEAELLIGKIRAFPLIFAPL